MTELQTKELREADLIRLGPCGKCGEKLMEGKNAGSPMFYVVTFAPAILDFSAIREQIGLGMQIGGVLARVMGPNKALAHAMPPTEFVLHQDCAMTLIGLMDTVERVNKRAAEKERGGDDT